jgi:hypothetical protein
MIACCILKANVASGHALCKTLKLDRLKSCRLKDQSKADAGSTILKIAQVKALKVGHADSICKVDHA